MSHVNTKTLIKYLDDRISFLKKEEENEGEYFDQIEEIEEIKKFVLENSI